MTKTYIYNGEDVAETELIRRIKKGETDLFSLLSFEYLSIINKYVSAIDCAYVDKDDFTQIGLLALYGAVDAYDFRSSSFSTFAALCIKRAILSEIRRASSKKQIPSSAITEITDDDIWDSEDPENTFINKESINVLTDKIKLSLSSFEYNVLTAYLKMGAYCKVADELGISVKDVNNALQRARKKIRKSINGSC